MPDTEKCGVGSGPWRRCDPGNGHRGNKGRIQAARAIGRRISVYTGVRHGKAPCSISTAADWTSNSADPGREAPILSTSVSVKAQLSLGVRVLVMAGLAPVHADELTLVENSCSSHVIHHAADAPETARIAAGELQRVIRRATGVTLSIASDEVTTPAIRIVSDSRLPHDGFELRISGKDLIIAGNPHFLQAGRRHHPSRAAREAAGRLRVLQLLCAVVPAH